MSFREKLVEPGHELTVLPPGQRDTSGFWFPHGYSDPRLLIRRRGKRTKKLADSRVEPGPVRVSQPENLQ